MQVEVKNLNRAVTDFSVVHDSTNCILLSVILWFLDNKNGTELYY